MTSLSSKLGVYLTLSVQGFGWVFLPIFLVMANVNGQSQPQKAPIKPQPRCYSPKPDFKISGNVACPHGLPPIGQWLLTRKLRPAHWLGCIFKGRKLREPINVIFFDTLSTSLIEAEKRLIAHLKVAGYLNRVGHSSGYQAYFNGRICHQFPRREGFAFSNAPFEFPNNHGRIFGPWAEKGGYYFIGAFSRETVSLFKKILHQYTSFNQARDDLAQKLNARSLYEIKGYVDLQNRIDSTEETTGDHDGRAVVFGIKKDALNHPDNYQVLSRRQIAHDIHLVRQMVRQVSVENRVQNKNLLKSVDRELKRLVQVKRSRTIKDLCAQIQNRLESIPAAQLKIALSRLKGFQGYLTVQKCLEINGGKK